MECDCIVAGEKARLQFTNPVPTFCEREIPVLFKLPLDSTLIKFCVVKGPEYRGQSAQRPDQCELRCGHNNCIMEANLLRKRDTIFGLALCL